MNEHFNNRPYYDKGNANDLKKEEKDFADYLHGLFKVFATNFPKPIQQLDHLPVVFSLRTHTGTQH